jgi:hypothetical protein
MAEGVFALDLSQAGLFLLVIGVLYLVFVLVGVGLSSLVTYSECQKTNVEAHFTQASYWAIYPTVSYMIMRVFLVLRRHFDIFYRGLDTSPAGAERAGWISIAYVMMLACFIGLFPLNEYSVTAVCVPTVDEANTFRNAMLAQQAEKAKAQETTPAVMTVAQS